VRLPHADRALQIVLRPGTAAPLPVFLLSEGKPKQLADGRFIEGDNVAAQYDLGIIYARGKKNPRDVGGSIKQNLRLATDWFFRAAANAHGEAAFYLGNLYASGSIDLKQDYGLALKWYRKADALGNIDALNNLGFLHDEGLGTRRDRAKAREYYTQGAEAGNAGAQMNLSAYYFEGLGGLRRDLAKALDWAIKADNQGEPGAAEKVTAITKIMKRGKK